MTKKDKINPNIIFVFADQMRAQVLGSYGNDQVPTPNFERMAVNGVVFDNAISTYPVCSPFRAMLLTGRYPMYNGTVFNDTGVRDDLPTWAQICKDNGYQTAYIGKWHLEWNRDPCIPENRRQGFEYWQVRNCAHDYFDSFYCNEEGEKTPLPDYEPEAQTELALNYIKEHRQNPFCLFLSWGPPHDPYPDVPEKYREQFPPDTIKLRDNVKGETEIVKQLLATDPTELSVLEKQVKHRRQHLRDILEDNKKLKEQYLQGYYAHTSALDQCMGKIMQTLEDEGIIENTIVVFTSDHGDMLGSHRMASKQIPFEEAIKIPFIVHYPGVIDGGTRTDVLMEPVDIMPSIFNPAGIPCPEIDGVNLITTDGELCDRHDAVLLMKMLPGGNPWMANGVTPWRGVRTKRYTYACLLDRGPWLLFDNIEDPLQLNNLIHDSEYSNTRNKMEEKMTQLLKKAGDPVDTKEIQDFVNNRRPD